MYFIAVLAVLVSFAAVEAGAQIIGWPNWNVTFYTDKECKDAHSTAQINQNFTCQAVYRAQDQVWSYFPVGPKTFRHGGSANFTVYTKENCPKAMASTFGQIAKFNTCNTGPATFMSYDMYFNPGEATD
ncbi:uncharacterized protein F4807DRAFT_460979 [Annulohypoxylon truncatum]|uniref:uncharacterized protein n=1 Tax=Annulohypoxylon truncatum TaxID=327061 RepID=UPI002007314F|nr:uncharacterized protein F4807DRAFT_460979 [Annulohypoxylon truncatum]KAI1209288.1 hypothetical protein F4807DRAFT_460979 [Annulohypoxylon truncatum]